MIQSVFELGDTIVREVMVPRTDLVFIERTKTLRQAMSLALRSGYSRIPVIGENLDDVVGMAYLKDVTKRVFDNHDGRDDRARRVDHADRACSCPTPSRPTTCCSEMQAQRTHVAIVVDEFGGTAGMVTIEDILEEIVGEITDEYDAEPEEREQLSDGVVAGQRALRRRRPRGAVRHPDRGRGRRLGRRPHGQAPRQGPDPPAASSRSTACASRPRRRVAVATASARCS